MKTKNPFATRNRKNKYRRAWPLKTTLLALLAVGRAAEAQDVIMPQPASATPQPAWQQDQTNEFQVFNPAVPNSTSQQSASQPFRWGELTARPHVFYRFTYGNGIQSDPSDQQDTIIQEISPGIAFDIGRHWSLDYTPTLRFYSDSHFQNEFDNSVTLSGQTAYEDWVFGASENFSDTSSPQAETATQTDQKTSSTSLSAAYAFNSKMSLDMSLGQNLTYVSDSSNSTNTAAAFDNLQNSRDWSTSAFLNYQFWSRLNAGVGGSFDYIDVDAGPNQTSESLSGQVNWRATDKISFHVNGGLQYQQFLSGGIGDKLYPIYGASIQYQPFEPTQISLSANRTVTPSLFEGLNTENTSFNCDLNQRFLKKFFVDFTAGYSIVKYDATTEAVDVSREDDSYSLGVRFSHAFLKRGTVGVSYQYSVNSSSAEGFSYTGSQVGIDVGYSY